MKRAHLFNVIASYLTYLKASVETLNSLNLQDQNVHAENFFRDFLNIVLGLNLKNINIVDKNAKAIDLGDEIERIAIQVTSTSEIGKIKHTYDGFMATRLHQTYDRLVVLIIGEKKSYREDTLGAGSVFTMSIANDVWGISELVAKIGDLSLEGIEQCRDFLRDELRIVEPRASNEVYTLVKLVEVLSKADEGLLMGDNREDPDPERKIHDRFAEHADYLEKEYVDLHEVYGRALAEVNKHTDLSHVRIRKLQIYLMSWSDRVLTECRNNPKVALDTLVGRILRQMGASDIAYDEGAIRYYLTDQLIACNVFPNKRTIDA